MHALIGAAARAAIAAACVVMLADAQTPPKPDKPGKPDKACSLEGASVMAFGKYDPVETTPLDVQGRISYRCGKDAAASRAFTRTAGPSPRDQIIVQISLSTGLSGRYDRHMRGGSDELRYNLYLDATRSVIWGDGTAGTQVYTAHAQPNNKVVTVPVFGRIFPMQDVAAAVYLDQLVVTLDF